MAITIAVYMKTGKAELNIKSLPDDDNNSNFDAKMMKIALLLV